MGNLATYITVKGERHKLHPVERSLTLGEHTFPVRTALDLDGGLILGEGDTGKTTFADIICDAARADGQQARRIPIRTQHTWQALRERVPDLHDGETATLVFDGLDEFPDCACDLADLAEELPQDRYRVWVTSRACPAASTLCHRSGRFDSIYRLARFTEDDVRTLAKSVGLDGDDFIDTVHASNLDVYLEKPGSVVLLLQLFANGELTRLTRAEFMEKISRAFARETRDGEIRDEPSPYSEDELVDAAGWVAVCLELGGKSAVWTDTADSAGKDDLPLEELLKGPYGKALIREAFRRRSFEPLSDRRLRVTYSEMSAFLAGRWIARHVPIETDGANAIMETFNENMDPHCVLPWAAFYRPEYGLRPVRERPEVFSVCHALIKHIGFGRYFRLLCGTDGRRAGDAVTATGDVLTYIRKFNPQMRLDLSGLAGFTSFAEYLLDELNDPDETPDRLLAAARMTVDCRYDHEKTVAALVAAFGKADVANDAQRRSNLAYYIAHACGRARRPKSLEALRARHDELLKDVPPKYRTDDISDEFYWLHRLFDFPGWLRLREELGRQHLKGLKDFSRSTYGRAEVPPALIEANGGKPLVAPPPEREIAAVLEKDPKVETVQFIIEQEEARGLPYVALRRYFDRLFADVETAITANETMAARAIRYDIHYFARVVRAIEPSGHCGRNKRIMDFIVRNNQMIGPIAYYTISTEDAVRLIGLIESNESYVKRFDDFQLRMLREHSNTDKDEDLGEYLTPAEIAALVPAVEVKAKAAFPFITRCDPHAEIFQIKVKLSNGQEADRPFRICGEEKWHYLKQFAKAKESRVTLTPYRKGKRIALTLVFRKTHDDAPQLLRFIRSTKGSKAVYWLEQTQKMKEPAKNPNRPSKSSL